MDIADDIAYSTHDLEDALKANFLSPLDMGSLDEGIREKIADEVKAEFNINDFSRNDVSDVLYSVVQKKFQTNI